MNIANVAFISQSTFYSIQKNFLYPAIHRVYTTNRTLLLESAKEKSEIHLLADGRCDSPDCNAKYGTYTLMDSQSGHILDFDISHVVVAGNSYELPKRENILKTIAQIEKPNKEEAIKNIRTRFSV